MVLPGRVQEPGSPAERRRATRVGGDELAQPLELGQLEPVDVCLDRDVAVLGQLRPQRVEHAGDGSGCRERGVRDAHLDALDRECGCGGLGPRVQQAACGDLGGLDVGLIEGVDAQHPPRDRRRVLPHDELRGERSADEDLALVMLAEMELVRLVDDAHDLQVGGLASTSGETGSRTTGRMPVPSLPVDSATSCSIQSGSPTMCVPSVTRPSLSRRGVACRRSRRRARARGCRGCRSRPRGAWHPPRRGVRRCRRRRDPSARARTR